MGLKCEPAARRRALVAGTARTASRAVDSACCRGCAKLAVSEHKAHTCSLTPAFCKALIS